MIAAFWNLRAAYCAWRSARLLRASKLWAAARARAEIERRRWMPLDRWPGF